MYLASNVSLRKTRVCPTNKIYTDCLCDTLLLPISCDCQVREGWVLRWARVTTLHPTKISNFYRFSHCFINTTTVFNLCSASALLPRSSTHFAAIFPISSQHRPCVPRRPPYDLCGSSSRYLMVGVTDATRPCVVDSAYHSNREAQDMYTKHYYGYAT